jgi:hypothetical protein
LRTKQFRKSQALWPRIRETLQMDRNRGALFDERLHITQAQRDRLREVLHGLFSKAKRLVGDRDVIVCGGIGRVQRKRLLEELDGLIVAAILLHHVAQQHEAMRMSWIAGENRATQGLGRRNLAIAVVGRRRREQIFDCVVLRKTARRDAR